MLLIGIIIALIIKDLNNKNTNLEKQETIRQQLTETTDNNAYVTIADHLSEVKSQTTESIEFDITVIPSSSSATTTDYVKYPIPWNLLKNFTKCTCTVVQKNSGARLEYSINGEEEIIFKSDSLAGNFFEIELENIVNESSDFYFKVGIGAGTSSKPTIYNIKFE